jgi:hypothetical protein
MVMKAALKITEPTQNNTTEIRSGMSPTLRVFFDPPDGSS